MDFVEITSLPIDLASWITRVRPVDCGATVTLDGYARAVTREKGTGEIRYTDHLVYEAYEEMAVGEMRNLISIAKAEFEVSTVGIIHRTGRIAIGETSVLITVSAPHRKAAFAACEWLITELKRTVPIWKKEVYANGGEAWVEGDNPIEQPQ